MKKIISFIILLIYGLTVSVFSYSKLLNTKEKFIASLLFILFSCLVWCIFILINVSSQHLKIGYLAPIAFVNAVYSVLNIVLNIIVISSEDITILNIVSYNLVLIFLLAITTLPMYYMGKNKA